MTIASQTSRISYTGDGVTTAFAVPFFFQANADLVVYLQDTLGNQTLQLLGTHYNLTGATISTGGTCTFVAAPATDYLISIYRDPPATQTTSYNNNDPFPAKSHELALDKLTTLEQRTRDLIGRAIRQSDGEPTMTTLLAPIAVRKNKLLGFDANGAFTYSIVGPAAVTLTGSVATPQGRLTLTSGVAVTQSDVTGATIVYYTPGAGGGNQVPINGVSTTFTELPNVAANSVTGYAGPAAVAANSMYDFYVWNNAGTVTLTRSPAWVSDTARGTGAGTAERQSANGVFTNKFAITNGPGAGLGTLVGTARSDGSSQFTDSVAKRWLSNIYNATPRAMSVLETTASWTYALAVWRQARAVTSNQLDFVQSVSGNTLAARVAVTMSNSGTASFAVTGIGINSTSVNVAMYTAAQMASASTAYGSSGFFTGVVGEGRNYAAWLEYNLSGTMTYTGQSTVIQSGIMGEILN